MTFLLGAEEANRDLRSDVDRLRLERDKPRVLLEKAAIEVMVLSLTREERHRAQAAWLTPPMSHDAMPTNAPGGS